MEVPTSVGNLGIIMAVKYLAPSGFVEIPTQSFDLRIIPLIEALSIPYSLRFLCSMLNTIEARSE